MTGTPATFLQDVAQRCGITRLERGAHESPVCWWHVPTIGPRGALVVIYDRERDFTVRVLFMSRSETQRCEVAERWDGFVCNGSSGR